MTVQNNQGPLNNPLATVGFNNISIYPYGKDQTFINEGYQKNQWVYSIVSKCAKKFSQVQWYHYKIKTSERKTFFDEYMMLTKNHISDPRARLEAMKMRKKSVDQVVVNDGLGKLLAKPNRNQSGAQFREQLYGYKLLTGEGNQWTAREGTSAPSELFIIPKNNLALVRGGSPWTIAGYKMLLTGATFDVVPEDVIMWKFPSYRFEPVTLDHLRGQAPLDAGILLMQASNEGTMRMANMNANQGAAGLAYNKADTRQWSVEQAMFNRRQFNSIINDSDLAGTIAYMSGEWGFLQFGLSVEQLKLIEQSDIQFKGLCNIFDVPWQLFGNADSYENRKQYKRDFVYDNIAVASYSLRDEWNAKLIPQFGLDRERDVIDCDILSLPELVDDLKTQGEAITRLWQLTPNEAREYMGYDRNDTDPNMNKVYIPTTFTPLDELNAQVGGGMDG